MKGPLVYLGIIAAVLLLTLLLRPQPATESPSTSITTMKTLTISSSAFDPNGSIPARYTCDGENMSPPLTIEGVPDDTKSFALIMDDPDAPGDTWVHWTVWNIHPKNTWSTEGSGFSNANSSKYELPLPADEGVTSFGKPGYGGPCPPSGTHRYFFKVYALDRVLDLKERSNKENLESAMEGHILAQGELIGLYRRSK